MHSHRLEQADENALVEVQVEPVPGQEEPAAVDLERVRVPIERVLVQLVAVGTVHVGLRKERK
jgi:hypothetical protein